MFEVKWYRAQLGHGITAIKRDVEFYQIPSNGISPCGIIDGNGSQAHSMQMIDTKRSRRAMSGEGRIRRFAVSCKVESVLRRNRVDELTELRKVFNSIEWNQE